MNYSLYSYSYKCPRWYGNVNGVNNIFVEDDQTEENVKDLAKNQMNTKTGSQTCDIQLLNKFDLVVKSVKTYPSLTCINIQKNQDMKKFVMTDIKDAIDSKNDN